MRCSLLKQFFPFLLASLNCSSLMKSWQSRSRCAPVVSHPYHFGRASDKLHFVEVVPNITLSEVV